MNSFETYYDRDWLHLGGYFETHRMRFLMSWKFIESLCPPPGEDAAGRRFSVLDVGGVGPLAAYLQKYCAADVHETKTDLRRPLASDSHVHDLVLCTEVIEHVKDQDSDSIADLEAFNYSGIDQMLGELHRVAKADGHVFISTPNASSMIVLLKWLNRQTPLMDPQHSREFTVDDLKAHCRKAGFAAQRVETPDVWSDEFGEPLAALKDRLNLRGAELSDRGDNILGLFRPQKRLERMMSTVAAAARAV